MTSDDTPRRASGLLRAAACLGALALSMILIASLGRAGLDIDPLHARLIALADALVRGGTPAAAYLLAALGLGRLARPAFSRAANPWPIQMAVGLAIALSLSHALAWSSLLCNAGGPLIARGVTFVGLALLAHQLAVGHTRRQLTITLPWPIFLAMPAVAVLLVAAASPPGWLWDSEFGGYDALSYHLQLPQEWFIRGSLHPLEHNVYSYLPSYVEAAFIHVGALMGVPTSPQPGSAHIGLVAGDGVGLLACQYLHAGITIVAAWIIAAAAGEAIILARASHTDGGAGIPPASSNAAGGACLSPAIGLIPALAGIIVLSTPWTIVVGSLAYNEMAMIALGAGAFLVACESGLSRLSCGAIVGALIGVACGAKPTALLMFTAPVSLLLIAAAYIHVRQQRRNSAMFIRVVTTSMTTFAAAAVAGMIMLLPWLIRNALHGGNPVFPFLTSIFGHAHWTPEQVARYAAAHSFQGSLADRLALIVLPDASDPAGQRHRGMLHPQWFAFFPAVILASGVAIVRSRTRLVAVTIFTGFIVQAFIWLFATHVQSRFLLPLVIPGAILVALSMSSRVTDNRRSNGIHCLVKSVLPLIPAVILIVLQTIALVVIFAHQRSGMPNRLLAAGPPQFSGELIRQAFAAATPEDQRRFLEHASPEVVLNLLIDRHQRITLVGGATPLYIRPPVIYATTWDLSPLGEVVRGSPTEPETWARTLRATRITAILVDFGELNRLHRCGWLDPALDPDDIAAWLDLHTTRLRAWPQTGQAIFLLRPPEPAP